MDLIGVDYGDLHYSFADICANLSEPVSHLGSLGWICIGPPDSRTQYETHTIEKFSVSVSVLGSWMKLKVVESWSKHSSTSGKSRVMGQK